MTSMAVSLYVVTLTEIETELTDERFNLSRSHEVDGGLVTIKTNALATFADYQQARNYMSQTVKELTDGLLVLKGKVNLRSAALEDEHGVTTVLQIVKTEIDLSVG